GALHVRVFGGAKAEGASLRQAIEFAAETLKRGAEDAGTRGLILGVEDDGGITDFAKDTIAIVKRADSPWAGMNLDIGNFRPPSVYDQIDMSIPYAVSTHVKTEVALDDGKTRGPADWDRVFKMIEAARTRCMRSWAISCASMASDLCPRRSAPPACPVTVKRIG